ncbi:hypothetical protein MFTT_21900 [Mycolicibacterium fortuitum subsp. fortuitum]|nr:hypothetical protein MFTT_21900 [Mycolicibacterium fortuitum subsp. fortuitum]
MSQTPGSAREIPVGATTTNMAAAAKTIAEVAIRRGIVLGGLDVVVVVFGIAAPPIGRAPAANAPQALVKHRY